jgi:FMN reductase
VPTQLLIVSSNLKPASNSLVLAREAERVLREDGHEVAFLDLRDLPLPLCDGGASFEHPNVLRADQLVAHAQGIIVSTPIYNYDANSALKNFIEHTGQAWENKVVGFLCNAGGSASFMSIMSIANSLMLDFRCVIVPRFVYALGTSFKDGAIVETAIAARVAECARAAAHLADALKPKP